MLLQEGRMVDGLSKCTPTFFTEAVLLIGNPQTALIVRLKAEVRAMSFSVLYYAIDFSR